MDKIILRRILKKNNLLICQICINKQCAPGITDAFQDHLFLFSFLTNDIGSKSHRMETLI